MTGGADLNENSWQTTAGEQFKNLKEKMIASTKYTEKKAKEFSKIASKELDGVITYLASPSNAEMIAFYEDKGFKDKIKYVRKDN